MKTYKETIERPRLVIQHDAMASNPRDEDNLGYFITVERNYNCPDNEPELQDIVKEEQHGADNAQQHAENVTKRIEEERNEKVLYITPVYRYEHGRVAYKRGHVNDWDASNCGFYIVTDKTANVLGTPLEHFEDVIDGELERYIAYANGEVWCFELYDENGELIDGYGDIYDIEEIKEGLVASHPEWKDEDIEQYIKD